MSDSRQGGFLGRLLQPARPPEPRAPEPDTPEAREAKRLAWWENSTARALSRGHPWPPVGYTADGHIIPDVPAAHRGRMPGTPLPDVPPDLEASGPGTVPAPEPSGPGTVPAPKPTR